MTESFFSQKVSRCTVSDLVISTPSPLFLEGFVKLCRLALTQRVLNVPETSPAKGLLKILPLRTYREPSGVNGKTDNLTIKLYFGSNSPYIMYPLLIFTGGANIPKSSMMSTGRLVARRPREQIMDVLETSTGFLPHKFFKFNSQTHRN